MTLRAGLFLLCCPLVGCATARVVRLDTGEGTPIVYTPARRIPPVEIDQREFEKAMTTLLLEMKLSMSDEGQAHLRLASATEEPGGRYHRWCSQQSSPDECLSLLQGDLSLADASVRRQLALSFAWDGVWDGVAAEMRGFVDPVMLKLMIGTAFAAYVGLLILPEPVTKVVAITLTTFLVAYVGFEVFFNILNGWRELSARSERAVSFGELEDAGHRFGDVMGRDGARVIIMAMTAALGGGDGWPYLESPSSPPRRHSAQPPVASDLTPQSRDRTSHSGSNVTSTSSRSLSVELAGRSGLARTHPIGRRPSWTCSAIPRTGSNST